MSKVRELLRNLHRWVPAILKWFFTDPGMQPVRWIALVGGLLALALLLIGLPFDCLERKIRTSGWILQVIGFGITFRGLLQVQELFGRQFRQTVREAWNRRPLFKGRIIAVGAMEAIEAGDTARARGEAGLPPGLSVEERLERAERQIEALYNVIGDHVEENERKLTELVNTIKAERGERVAGQEALATRLDQAVAGSVYPTMAGVLLFVVGVIAGTSSPEIANELMGQAASCYPS